jgi:hypothetical protein
MRNIPISRSCAATPTEVRPWRVAAGAADAGDLLAVDGFAIASTGHATSMPSTHHGCAP